METNTQLKIILESCLLMLLIMIIIIIIIIIIYLFIYLFIYLLFYCIFLKKKIIFVFLFVSYRPWRSLSYVVVYCPSFSSLARQTSISTFHRDQTTDWTAMASIVETPADFSTHR